MKRFTSVWTAGRLVLTCGLLVLVLTATSGGAAFAQEPEPEPIDVTGVLNTIWGDPGPEFDEDFPTVPEYLLFTDAGEVFALDGLVEATSKTGGPFEFNRKAVRVTGELDPETNRIRIDSIQLVEDEPPIISSHLLGGHVSGSQKWATLLCRFGDSTGVTPEPRTFFEDLMDLMDDFWQEVSYNNIDLAGSVEVDWVNLPQNRADYLDDPTTHFAGHTLNWGEIALDCASAADASVNFPDFDGINFMFNGTLDCCSWGGSVTLNLDGMNKTYAATWMATWGWGNQDVLGQEMGHGFGLPHSSGPYTSTYDSAWDVMSQGGTCSPADPDFGCLGVHTVSAYKDALGWIPAGRMYLATADPDQLIFIERLALSPGAGGTYQGARISIGGSMTDWYTIEVRKFAGYDDQVPGEAVLLHKLDTLLGDRNAQVVDDDGDGDPDDAGAMWVTGELFEDAPNNISVAILEMEADGWWVLINPTPADLSITKSDSPDPVAAGTQLTYTVTVENAGPDDAEDVTVVDVLPPEVSYVSDTGGCLEAPAGTLTCSLGTVVSGGSAVFTITVDVPPDLVFNNGGLPVVISNTAEVFEDHDTGFDPDIANNSTTIDTTVVAEADLAITSFTASALPAEVLIGDSVNVTLDKSVVNLGPSSPIDVEVNVTAAPSAGIDVTPPAANQVIPALAVGGVGQVMESFTLTCTGPGVQQVTFTNTVSPIGGSDPDLANNTAEVTVEVECLLEVAINIHPGSFPNSINMKSKEGVVPLAILTTSAGEYGLPLAVDATAVDPLSVHFGPADLLFNVDPPGGATEAHNLGHIEDSFELDELTQDGDLDMVLHFRRPETGLDFADSEACVKGEIEIGGMLFTFFGCDSISPRP